MKTSELNGAALDWAVCVADGETRWEWLESPCPYSTNWLFGGPIIEREQINIVALGDEVWEAWPNTGLSEDIYCQGPTPLIAAMRCYVASKLGDDVEVPAELLTA